MRDGGNEPGGGGREFVDLRAAAPSPPLTARGLGCAGLPVRWPRNPLTGSRGSDSKLGMYFGRANSLQPRRAGRSRPGVFRAGAHRRTRAAAQRSAQDAQQLLPASIGRPEGEPARAGPKVRKGRPGVARELAEHPDDVREVFAATCTGCGQPVTPADQPELAHAYDHIDLPPLRPIVTRVNLHRGACPCCGARVGAPAPHECRPAAHSDPGIAALVTYLHARHMVSYNRLVEISMACSGLRSAKGRSPTCWRARPSRSRPRRSGSRPRCARRR